MKKFLSFLLTFVMLFSLAMPAMAAEVTGNTEGEVSGTFNPEIAFTGVEVSNQYDLIDKGNGNYIAAVAPGDTGTDITYKYVGNNLEYLTADNTLLKTREDNSTLGESESSLEVMIETGFTGRVTNWEDGDWWEWEYSNDGGITWEGVHVDVKQGYTITNATTDTNGTITVPEYSVADETVVMTVTPADGYMLDSLTVTDAESNSVTVENNSFTMPASAVTVNATFKEAPVPQPITVAPTEHGTVSADKETATVGTTVTLTVNPADDYRLAALTINDGAVEFTPVDDTTYTFVMPDAEVTVNATFELIPGKVTNLTIIVDGVEYEGPGNALQGMQNPVLITPSTKTVTVKLYGTHLDRLNEGSAVIVYVKEYPLYNGSWQFSDDYTTATMDIEPEVFADIDGETFGHIWFSGSTGDLDDDYNEHLFYEYVVRTFSVTNNTAADANGTLNAPTEAEECSTVTLTVTPATGYKIGSVTVKDAEGNTVEFTETGVVSGTYKFIMPASDVTVTATFEALPITSAEITWGSMSFTYDDTIAEGATEENGWTCESGANNIVVENTGETTFTAQATYASYEGYESITGSFNPASVELAPASGDQAGEEYTFTLELSGKPTKALSGDKIGKVTITINEAAEE